MGDPTADGARTAPRGLPDGALRDALGALGFPGDPAAWLPLCDGHTKALLAHAGARGAGFLYASAPPPPPM